MPEENQEAKTKGQSQYKIVQIPTRNENGVEENVAVPSMELINHLVEQLQAVQRNQALSQYLFKLIADQNKELLKDSKAVVRSTDEIIEACKKFEELVDGWDDEHPLIEHATQFYNYITTKMQEAHKAQEKVVVDEGAD